MILNVIAAIVGYAVMGLVALWVFVYLYWHAHCTACAIIAECRVSIDQKLGLKWWRIPDVFFQKWFHDMRTSTAPIGGEEDGMTWPGVATWHAPNHPFSIGKMDWYENRHDEPDEPQKDAP